jgi:hypothetical protein
MSDSLADTIRELEDELWDREQCVKRLMDEMNCQLMEFSKVIQSKNQIISDLGKKLDVRNNTKK